MQDRSSQLIEGYINRGELKYGIERARRERTVPATAQCFFTPPPAQEPIAGPASFASTGLSIDFARFIDPTPLTVHPRLPLETVMEIFKKVGPRVVLVEHQGKLCGIVTRKDVLRFQFKMENREHPRSEDDIEGDRYREEKLWAFIVKCVGWMRGKWLLQGRRPAPDRELPEGSEPEPSEDFVVELDDRHRL